MVLYHGQETPYPYSTNFIDCFDDPHGIMQHFLSNPVEVIDIGKIPDESLQKRQLLGVIQAALKYSRHKNPEPHLIQIMRQIATLDFSDQRELQLIVKLVTNYVFTVGKSVNRKSILKAGLELPQPIRGEYMTIAEHLEAIGEARGKEIGKEIGEEIGETNKAQKVAINMHKLGLSPQVIAQSTELPLEQVLALIEEHDKT